MFYQYSVWSSSQNFLVDFPLHLYWKTEKIEVQSPGLAKISIFCQSGGGELKGGDLLDANLGGVTDDDLLGDFGDNFNILEFADALGNLINN